MLNLIYVLLSFQEVSLWSIDAIFVNLMWKHANTCSFAAPSLNLSGRWF